jgi:LysM repeat protein
METDKPTSSKSGNARQRHLMRQGRTRQPHVRHAVPMVSETSTAIDNQRMIVVWLKRSFSRFGAVTALSLMVLLIVLLGLQLLSGRIFPNVWSLGVSLGNMSLEDASTRLLEAWHGEFQIEVTDGERAWLVAPSQVGLRLDARRTAEAARVAGLAGIPFGYSVEPVVNLDSEIAQAYFESLTDEVNIPPYNAGFAWQGEQFVGVPGREGRILNISDTLSNLLEGPGSVVSRRRLELIFNPLLPEVVDPAPYLEEAHLLAEQPFTITAYDPFTNEMQNWSVHREGFTSWLEATPNGLGIREDDFSSFLETQSAALNLDDTSRYFDSEESLGRITAAVRSAQPSVSLRIRYYPTMYTVVSGDTGYRIARKTGIPFYLIEQANPQVDLSVLSPGDELNLPSWDIVLPLEPISSKRIIINLDTQWLVAYENGQEVLSWAISSGIERAPTSPGVFQVLSHERNAYGSSYLLCDDSGCGQWEMEWFMGLYEVVPGLMNGFHGAVLLPDNTYLGGGNVGTPYTLGCVMSRSEDAQRLYEWAEDGTIVEIISSEFAPLSDLGRLTLGS